MKTFKQFLTEEDDDMSDVYDMLIDLYGDDRPVYRIVDKLIQEDKQIIHYYRAEIIDTTEFINEINTMIDEGEEYGPTLTYPSFETVGLTAALRHLNSGKLVSSRGYGDICYCRDKKPLEKYIRWKCGNRKYEEQSINQRSLEMSLQNLNALP